VDTVAILARQADRASGQHAQRPGQHLEDSQCQSQPSRFSYFVPCVTDDADLAIGKETHKGN
jgi:hypothetical protein